MTYDVKYLFICLFTNCRSFLVRCLLRSLAHFSIRLFVYFGEAFFIRYVARRYFLPVCGLSFHYLDSVFYRAKVFHFNEVQLISYFFHCAFGIISKKSLPNPRSYRFSSVLSSRSFIVLHFTFRSVISIQLIFVKVCVFFSVWMSSSSSTICWISRLGFFVLPLLLCQRSVDSMGVYFWTLFTIPLIYLSIFFSPIARCLDYCRFTVKSWSWVVSVSQKNFVLLQYCVGYSRSFASPYKF